MYSKVTPFFFSSLKIKIIFIFLVSALIPFMVIATFIYVDVKSSAEKNALDKVHMLATIQKIRTLELIEKYTLQLEQFATRLQLRLELANFNQTQSPASQAKIKQIITEAKIGTSNIKDISILNGEGLVIASTNPTAFHKDHSPDEFFKKGKHQNDMSEFFKIDQAVYLHLAGPLTLDNKNIGVVVVDISTEDLFRLFKDYTGLGETGSWGLAKKEPSGDALIIVPGRFDTNPDSPLKSRVDKNSQVPLIHAVAGNETVFPDIVNYLGNHVVAATAYIQDLVFPIGVTQDRDELLAVSHRLTVQLIFFVALLAIFIGFLTSIIAQIITGPITKLTKAATQVAAGDLNTQVTINSQDEIGTLASIFNAMTSKLKTAYETLEDQIKQRTYDLDEKVVELEKTNKLMVGRELKMVELKRKLKKYAK